MCSALHQRYADFGPAIGPALARVFSPASKGGSEDGKRKRAALRLLTELIIAGVSSDASLLTGIMRELVGAAAELHPPACCWGRSQLAVQAVPIAQMVHVLIGCKGLHA